MTDAFDIVIVGGGLVGASMACALDGAGLSVAIIEAQPLRDAAPASYDDRTLALSLDSCQIFQQIGLWPGLGGGVTPIEQVQVSNLGQFGQTRLRAAELGVPVLGNVVEARVIGEAVRQRLPQLNDLTVISPAQLLTVKWQKRSAKLTIDRAGDKQTISAQLVIGADGTDSLVRRLCQFEVEQYDYQQSAIIANLTPSKPHRNIAWERLTETGPLAMLPHVGERCGLVWVTKAEQVEALMALPDQDFLARVEHRFGLRLGPLRRLGKRASYPLRLLYARQQYRPRAVIIGNAAHTVHNVAAQGFNLGLRDVTALAELLRVNQQHGGDPGEEDLLARYQQLRVDDQQMVVRFTDGLIRGLAQDFAPFKLARSLGLIALDSVPGLKQALADRAMGFTARRRRTQRLDQSLRPMTERER